MISSGRMAVPFVVLLLVVTTAGWVTSYIYEKENRRQDRALRAANYRICARQQQVRAELWLTRRDAKAALAGGLKRVERFLPILDCLPNLCGHVATVMPTWKAWRYVRQYENGMVDPTPVEPPRPWVC